MINNLVKWGVCIFLFFTSAPAGAVGLDGIFDRQSEVQGGSLSEVANWADEIRRVQADESRMAAEPLVVNLRIEPLQLSRLKFEPEIPLLGVTDAGVSKETTVAAASPACARDDGACLLLNWQVGEQAAAPASGSTCARDDGDCLLVNWQAPEQAAIPATNAACARNDSDCLLVNWDASLDALAGRPRREQLDAVQAMVNALPYREDQANWGRHDYWATPKEMISRGGDCEDYASAKYWALRRLGVAEKDMRIVVVHDDHFNSSHAVLVVRMNGEALVLDNQAKDVMPAAEARGYHPLYSVNEDGWWMYRSSGMQMASTAGMSWPAAAEGGRITLVLRTTRAPTRWNSANSFNLAAW